MQNTSAIELRRRAMALGDQKTMDLMFAYLLDRVTRIEASGLEVVIESEQPHGYNPARNVYDRVYIVDIKSKQRVGTRLSRLRWDYAINCVKIAVKIEPAQSRGGPRQPDTPATDEQLRALRSEAQKLIEGARIPDVFNESSEMPVTRKSVTRAPAFGAAMA